MGCGEGGEEGGECEKKRRRREKEGRGEEREREREGGGRKYNVHVHCIGRRGMTASHSPDSSCSLSFSPALVSTCQTLHNLVSKVNIQECIMGSCCNY